MEQHQNEDELEKKAKDNLEEDSESNLNDKPNEEVKFSVRYNLLYKSVNACLYHIGVDQTILLLRKALEKKKNGISSKKGFPDPEFFIRKLFKIVSKPYGIMTDRQLIEDKERHITEARKICFALMKWDLKMQYNEIALIFFKDPSTICRQVIAFQKKIKDDRDFEEKFKAIRKEFQQWIDESED